MSAISTVLLEFLKPGDLLLYSSPLYGGTDHFINHFLPKVGVHGVCFRPGDDEATIQKKLQASGHANKLAMVYIETPANPTNALIDIAMCRKLADTINPEAKLAVDNTYMGPLWSHPLKHGADLVLYSATKYIGGHSDVIAGAVVGSAEIIQRVKVLRTFLGNMASPHTCWLLLRSLETLKVRMEQQALNAQHIATYLSTHPKIDKVYYLGLLEEDAPSYTLYKKQYESPGAMISIDIKGGEKAAFQFLNHLKLFRLAVSLGSTESLAQHPATMTHVGVDAKERQAIGVTENLVRLSIGLEHHQDLIADIEQALATLME